MTEEEKEAIEQLKSWRKYIIKNKDRVNKANDLEFYLRTALNLTQELEKKNERIEQLETDKQKLIEKLEENIKQYHYMTTVVETEGYEEGYYKGHISEAQEILFIVKGENNE